MLIDYFFHFTGLENDYWMGSSTVDACQFLYPENFGAPGYIFGFESVTEVHFRGVEADLDL